MIKIFKKFSKLFFGISLLTAITSLTYFYYRSKSTLPQKISAYKFSRPDSRADILAGKVITLKRLNPEYFYDFYKMYDDPLVTTPLYSPDMPEEVQYSQLVEHLKYELEKEANGLVLSYMIFDNKDNKLVGALEIREPDPSSPGQFGCWINPKYWGNNRFQEAFKLISNEYFRLHPNTEKFTAHVKMWNLRGYFALKKSGFKLIKTLHFQDMPSRYFLEYYNPNLKIDKNFDVKTRE